MKCIVCHPFVFLPSFQNRSIMITAKGFIWKFLLICYFILHLHVTLCVIHMFLCLLNLSIFQGYSKSLCSLKGEGWSCQLDFSLIMWQDIGI